MIARRSTLTAPVSLCVLVCLFALSVAPRAGAAVTHEFRSGVSAKLSEGVPSAGPKGETVPLPGPFGQLQSMTVDSGELYVAESTGGGESRIDVFGDSSGAFALQFPQFSSPLFLRDGITVGHSTGEAQVYVAGDVYPEGSPRGAVAVLSPAGSLKGVWTGADTPSKGFACFECNGPARIAVDANPSSLNDWAAGDVYVTDWKNDVVDVFQPEVGGKEKYVAQLTGPEPPGKLFSTPQAVAVNPSNGEVFVLDGAQGSQLQTVYMFKPAVIVGQYEFVGKLAGPPPGGSFERVSDVTVDGGNGDVYVFGGGPVVYEFNSSGEFVGRLTGTPVGSSGELRPFNAVAAVAVDPANHYVYVGDYRLGVGEPSAMDVFGPDVVIPDVTTGAVTGERATGSGQVEATLNGTVNPRKTGEASCRFAWGTTGEYGQPPASCEPETVAEGSSPVAVHARLSGLAPDTTYHYRSQASNKNGTNPGEAWQDMQFTTLGPGLHAQAVSSVRAESVTFDSKIDPHGRPTSYYFQYGTSSAYGTDFPALSEAAPHGVAVGSGEGDVEVAQHVQLGISPGTVYHYRVVALSELEPGRFEAFAGPDQTFTTQTLGLPFQLPDGRAWEMVSPPQKEGAQFGWISEAIVQASANGNAFADWTYFAPTEAEPVGNDNWPMVFLGRGPGGWSSRMITPPHRYHTSPAILKFEEYYLFSEDLSKGVMQPLGSVPPLAPEASEATPYLHTDYLNGSADEFCTPHTEEELAGSHCYQPLVSPANVPSGTRFGEEPSGQCTLGECGPLFRGASPDLSHVVLETHVALTATPTEGLSELYEWSASTSKLALVSLLPAGETNKGGGQVGGRAFLGNGAVTMRSVSDDGSRVIFTALASAPAAHLYLRDTTRGETIRLDVFQGVKGGPENETPLFATASADGSRIFFRDAERLTADAKPAGSRPDLYEYDLGAPAGSRLTDLSVDPNAPAEVSSVMGASEDGSYVYFAAAGALAPGAGPGQCGETTGTQLCNVYVRHAGKTTFLAGLSQEDSFDWNFGTTGSKMDTARVSPDGRWLAFMSNRSLTGYDTTDAVSGHPDEEVYLYDALNDKLVCASCNPTGARPVGVKIPSEFGFLPEVFAGAWVASNVPPGTGSSAFQTSYQSRYLSNSGRLFFNSRDALVPQDVNGTQDVYQYEPVGVGDCNAAKTTFSEKAVGCVSLISSGTAKEESVFLDASATGGRDSVGNEGGGDVFFLTTAKLAPQDFDDAYDIYDAHECRAASPCLAPPPVAPPPCTTEASCRPAPTPQPTAFGAPASATFAGAGNVASPSKPAVHHRKKPRQHRRHRRHGPRRGKKSRKANAIGKARG